MTSDLAAVRHLRRADMAQVAEVFRSAFDQRLPWLAGRHTPEQDRVFFEGSIFESCDVWGAVSQDRLLGFIALRDEWVDHLYVLPTAQRRGLGRTLLRLAKARCDRLSIWTFQRNDVARRFYEAEGFIAVATTNGDNEELEPDIRYTWSVDPSSLQSVEEAG